MSLCLIAPPVTHVCDSFEGDFDFLPAHVGIIVTPRMGTSPALFSVCNCPHCGARMELRIRNSVLGWREIPPKRKRKVVTP